MYTVVSNVLNIKKGVVRLLVLFSLCVSVLSLIIPIAIQTIVNTLAFSSLKQPLFILVVTVIFVLGLAGIIRLCQIMIVENIQQTFFTDIALRFAKLLPRLKIRELDAHRGPEIINRFFEVIPIQKTLSILLIYLIELGIQAITSFILLAFYHPYLLILDGILTIFFMLALMIPYRKAMESALGESDYKHKMVAWLEEYLHCVNLVKFNDNDGFLLKKVDDNIKKYLQYRTVHFNQIVKHFLAFYSIYIFANVALLGIGGYLVLIQQLTLGQLVASEIVLNALVYSFLRICYHLRDLYALAASSSKINSVLELGYEPLVEHELDGHDDIFPPHIGYENISYITSLGRQGLTDFSCDIKGSELVLFKTSSQIAKKILLDILLGFNVNYQGTVRLNGHIMTGEEKLILRKTTSYVHDIELFPGTLYENLTLESINTSKMILIDLFKRLDVLKDVESLPNGMNSLILNHRMDLTHDALNKLMVIRAILSKPKLLILDGIIDRLTVEDTKRLIDTIRSIDEPKPTVIFTCREHKSNFNFDKVVYV